MMNSILRINLTVLFFVLMMGICTSVVSAKMAAQPEISDGTYTYRARLNQVDALNGAGEVVWACTVYPTVEPARYDPNYERDMQLNVIISLQQVCRELFDLFGGEAGGAERAA